MMIDLQIASTAKSLPAAVDIEQWILAALAPSIKNPEITVRIVDEAESAHLNYTYRHKKGPTNILSFTYDIPAEEESDLLGDLIICAPLVAQEAIAQQKSLLAHWTHLIIHGTLHLQGYDHIEVIEAEIMENKEIAILAQFGYPNPYLL